MVHPKNMYIGLLSGQLTTTVFKAAFPFSPGFDIERVASVAEATAAHSWEHGTFAQALLELYNPKVSVFGSKPFPVPVLQKDNTKALQYAAGKIVTGTNGLSNGGGAVGDPASLGVSAVLLGKTDAKYEKAARDTVIYLQSFAPRFYNGAISHRANVPELWADFMYMAPPLLAYHAADQGDEALLRESVKQCGDYRQILRSPDKGVWMHIIGPESQDSGLWSTGNAWAAAGMARVLATVMKAPVAAKKAWREEAVGNLSDWIKEILDGAMAAHMDHGLLRNYLDDMDPRGHGFGEISGSALLASVAYRMVVLQPQMFDGGYVQWADRIRGVIGGRDKEGNLHVTEEGIATPAVNPLAWRDTTPCTSGSPEGQSFVVLMYAAWRDCVQVGICQAEGGLALVPRKRVHRYQAIGARHLTI